MTPYALCNKYIVYDRQIVKVEEAVKLDYSDTYQQQGAIDDPAPTCRYWCANKMRHNALLRRVAS